MTLISAALIALLCGLNGPDHADAQQSKGQRKTFSGPYDSEIQYPVHEGKAGQQDPAAMTEIKESVASSLVPEHAGLEITGTLTSGSKENQRQYPASFAINNGGRFRLDIQKENGARSIRIKGNYGKTKQGNQVAQELEDMEFISPFAVPSLLLEIAERKDAVVVDDGTVTIDGQSMHKVTITLSHARYGSPESASFYFDGNTHMLEKSAFVEHSMGNRSLVSLTVMTYGDYRQDQSLLLPHEYSETVNGQLITSLKVTAISITSSHDDSYFSF